MSWQAYSAFVHHGNGAEAMHKGSEGIKGRGCAGTRKSLDRSSGSEWPWKMCGELDGLKAVS